MWCRIVDDSPLSIALDRTTALPDVSRFCMSIEGAAGSIFIRGAWDDLALEEITDMIREFSATALSHLPHLELWHLILLTLHPRPPLRHGALDMITASAADRTHRGAGGISRCRTLFRMNRLPRIKSLASTALWFTAIMFTTFLIAALAFAPELSLIVIGAPGFDDVFRLGTVFIWVNGLFYLLKNQLRFELRSKAYSAVSIVHSLTTAGASVLLAYVFQPGIYGFLAGMIPDDDRHSPRFYHSKRHFNSVSISQNLKTILPRYRRTQYRRFVSIHRRLMINPTFRSKKWVFTALATVWQAYRLLSLPVQMALTHSYTSNTRTRRPPATCDDIQILPGDRRDILTLTLRRRCPLSSRRRHIMPPVRWSSSGACLLCRCISLRLGGIAKKTHLFV